jgi:cytidylate kinase
MSNLPLLVLISGPPGAGKSTLANALSAQLELPLLSMDLVKSGVAFTMTGAPLTSALPASAARPAKPRFWPATRWSGYASNTGSA